jgi:hypothetical protein
MTSVGIEPAIPAGERQQTHALESAATGICKMQSIISKNFLSEMCRRPTSDTGKFEELQDAPRA